MRAVICGDAHIGAIFGLGRPDGNGGNTRINDYVKSLNHIVDYTISSKAIVDAALKKLSNAGVSTFVIMGNHDYRRNGSSFTSSITSLAAADYPNVRMVLDPEVIEVSNNDGDSSNLLLLPFRDHRMYSGKGNKEKSVGFEAEIKSLIDGVKNQNPTIAVGHNFFYEGSYNDFGGSELMARPSAFEGCDVALMGHLHQFRVLRKRSPVCIYTGSMERSNFGDANVDKYFIDYDLSTKKASFKKVPSRELVERSIDLSGADFSDISDRITEEIGMIDLKEKIVRFKFAIDERVLPAVDTKSISDKLYAAGAFFVSKVIIEVIAKRIVRDNSVLEHEDDYSMFKAFVEKQELSKATLEGMLKEARNIMEA